MKKTDIPKTEDCEKNNNRGEHVLKEKIYRSNI